MADRRREPRYPAVDWRVRLWLTGDRVLYGRVENASLHGLRFQRSWPSSAEGVNPGEAYRVDVSRPGRPDFRCVALIRHRHRDTIGLETREALPVGKSGASRQRYDTSARPG